MFYHVNKKKSAVGMVLCLCKAHTVDSALVREYYFDGCKKAEIVAQFLFKICGRFMHMTTISSERRSGSCIDYWIGTKLGTIKFTFVQNNFSASHWIRLFSICGYSNVSFRWVFANQYNIGQFQNVLMSDSELFNYTVASRRKFVKYFISFKLL